MNRKLSLIFAFLGVVLLFFATASTFLPVAAAESLVADFTEDPTIGSAPLSVYFVDQSQGSPVSWSWDLGDGATESSQFFYHTFTAPGIYTVSLVVSDGLTSDEVVKTDLITVTYPSISALLADLVADSFGVDQTTGTAPLAVHFNDITLPDSWNWSWDFGDGSSSTEQHPVHSYLTPGTYTVSLTLSDADGAETQTIADLITVSESAETRITFREGFENVETGLGSIDALGWSVVNNDGDLYHDEPVTWSVGYDDTATYAHSGVKSMVALWYHRADPADPVLENDDWLLLPPVTIPDGYKAIYSFWVKAFSGNYVEDFNVKLATAGRLVGDFTVTLAEVRSQNANWRQFAYDLSDYAGQTVNLAVQYVSLNQFGLVVDDVSVMVVPSVEGGAALLDTDGDGVADSVDAFANDISEWLDTDLDGVGNNSDSDDDGDGMPDSWEIANGLGPLVAADAVGDLDGDGLTNLGEYLAGTDPRGDGTSISGRLVDEEGAPLAGIWVEASSSSLAQASGCQSDSDGWYVLKVAPASDYRVSVPGSGQYQFAVYNGKSLWEDATVVDVSSGSVSGVNFVLSPGLSISGTVSGLSSGQVVSVEVWSDSSNSWGLTTLTGGGSGSDPFSIGGLLSADDYRLTLRSGDYQSGYVGADGSVGGWSEAALFSGGSTGVPVVAGEGLRISGTISGLSAGDVLWVDAWSESSGLWNSVEVQATGAEASFQLTGLGVASDYRISFTSDNYGNGFFVGSPGGVAGSPGSWMAATLVDLSEGDVGGVDVVVDTAVVISGTVNGLGADDTALLTAWSASGGVSGSARIVGTGAALEYAITGLNPAADYQVMISAEGYLGGYYSLSGLTDSSAADLVDGTTSATGIDFTLSSGSSLSGSISGLGRGEELWVEAWSESAGYWTATSVTGSGLSTTYTLSGLPAVSDLEVTFRPENHPAQVHSGIVAGASLDCVVEAGYAIAGTISGAAGYEAITVSVESLARSSRESVTVFADAGGSAEYMIDHLGAASDYVLLAETATKKVFYGDVFRRENASAILVSNADQSGKDISMAAVSVYSLSGAVNGVAVGTLVQIDVWDTATGIWNGVSRYGPGLFELSLPAGNNYKLGLHAGGYMDVYYGGLDGSLLPVAVYDVSQAEAIDLSAGDTSIGGLLMTAGYQYSGTVYFDADGDSVADSGEELAGAMVEVTGGSISRSSSSDGRGRFVLEGLFPAGTELGGEVFDGSYAVTVLSSSGSYSGSMTITDSDVSAPAILIAAP